MRGGHVDGRGFGWRSQYSDGRWPGRLRRFGWGSWPYTPETADIQLVSWAQSCLAQAIGSWVPQSGALGPATRRAVQMFQSQQGLPASGALDNDTIVALGRTCTGPSGAGASAFAATTGSPSSRDFQQGTSQEVSTSSPAGCNEDRCASSYINWLQQSLNKLGARLNVTGVLDRATITAINKFKQSHGVSFREYYASPILEQALVRAGASSPPALRRLPCGPTSTTQLLPLLRRYASDIPPEYLLGWITVESGGKLGDLTKICERGYFQVHPEESQDLKLDHDRLSTDPDYSIQGGLKLVRLYAAGVKRLAAQYGLSQQGDLFWSLVKLRHWIPSAPERILAQMRRDGVPIANWQAIRQYVYSKPGLGFGSFDPRDGVKSVDHYLALVARWRAALAARK